MADLICPRCGEPWDMDCIHEEVAARKEEGDSKATFTQVARQFAAEGCGKTLTAYGFGRQCKASDSDQAALSAVMFDLLGDDVDGIANEMEDFAMMGGFEPTKRPITRYPERWRR